MNVIDREWVEYRADCAAGIVRCIECRRNARDDEYLTEINPEGGFGRPRVLVCDNCLPLWRAALGESDGDAARL